MKTLAFALLFASITAASADDNLLRNGDFSLGLADWEGDIHTIDSDSVDPSSDAAPTSGVGVKLRHLDWTKVTQDFDGKVGEYLVTITYSVSSDLEFSTNLDDYTNVPGKVDFSRLSPFSSSPGKWALVINDLGAMHYHYWKITPKLDASGVQRVSVHVQLDSDDSSKKGFYLLFPPGQGLITLQSISLVPQAVSANP